MFSQMLFHWQCGCSPQPAGEWEGCTQRWGAPAPPDTPSATCWEEKPPDETPAQTKPAQKALEVTVKDPFSKKLHEFILCLFPKESSSLRRRGVAGCLCRWPCSRPPAPGRSTASPLLSFFTGKHHPGGPHRSLTSVPHPAAFSKAYSAPRQVFHAFEAEEKHLDQLPKTSACHLSPLPAHPCLALLFPALAWLLQGHRFIWLIFIPALVGNPRCWGGGGGAGWEIPQLMRFPPGDVGTDSGRVLLKKAHGNSFYQ